MLKMPIEYKDFLDRDAEDVICFNLTKTEIMDLELGGPDGSLSDWFKRLIENKDQAAMYFEFKRLIGKAYGKISDDGKSFLKSDELSEEFFMTAAFDALMVSFMNDEQKLLEWLKGTFPEGMFEAAVAKQEQQETVTVQGVDVPPPPR